MIDLHLHSSFSDGSKSPSELIEIALQRNMRAIALTDHDTIQGVEEFLNYGEDKNIILIPGIEITIKDEPERELMDVHILGLNIDHRCANLQNVLEKQERARNNQKRDICNRLNNEFGYNITYDEVKAIAKGSVVGRPHIVEILLNNNPKIAESMTKNDMFLMISVGGKAYVEREFELTLEDSIQIIEEGKGIPLLAHPGIYQVSDREEFIKMCIDAGIRGIEVEYPYDKNRPYSRDEKKAAWAMEYFPRFYQTLAEKYNLIKSGGTDYHGGKKGIEIGEISVPDEYLKKIM